MERKLHVFGTIEKQEGNFFNIILTIAKLIWYHCKAGKKIGCVFRKMFDTTKNY